jgi:hypothetical protein
VKKRKYSKLHTNNMMEWRFLLICLVLVLHLRALNQDLSVYLQKIGPSSSAVGFSPLLAKLPTLAFRGKFHILEGN